MNPKPYAIYRPGLTEKENALLDHIIREMAEVRSLSLWCYYNANWVKRDMAMGRKIA